MPASQTILGDLTRIANDLMPLAIAWHAVLALALAGLATGRWQPTRRLATYVLAVPVLQVSAVAWATGNPFNGGAFMLIAALMAAFGARLPETRVRLGPPWAVLLGAAVIAYAWVYPHFLVDQPGWMYLLAAPVGLIPCPTLSAVLGLGLLAGGFSRGWALTAAVAGSFYGLFGAVVLGVWLDIGLLVAALGCFGCAIAVRPHPADDAAKRNIRPEHP